MPLLADYAITPDVFDINSYTSEEVCGLHLREISEVMRSEGLVRDLRSGEWRGLFADGGRSWHRWGKELVGKLAKQGRLVGFRPALTSAPADDQGWCAEALATHTDEHPLMGGVIATKSVKEEYAKEPLVFPVDRLSGAKWWAPRDSSVRLARTLSDYQKHLNLILRCSNSILFIDPHLDPARQGYRDFGVLLARSGGRSPAPKIEIHRVCYEGSGPDRRFPMKDDDSYFERRFHDELEGSLRAAGLQAEVFVWDDFHDRYLISNLIGILLPNGFDTTTNPNAITTWARLRRKDRDDIQLEFEPNSMRHHLYKRFFIP